LAENLRANSRFFAVPWKASGGSAVAVFRLAQDALGRAPNSVPCLRGHKSPATCFDLSPFKTTQIATGSVEGSIFIWDIPEGGLTKDLNEPTAVLTSAGKVTGLRYHPYVGDLLVSAASSFDGHFLEFWNIEQLTNKNKPELSILVHEQEPIIDFDFHPKSNLVATTSKGLKDELHKRGRLMPSFLGC
jgi:WD40 repeat protein